MNVYIVTLSEFVKRTEYKDAENFDSLTSRNKLKYPVTKFFVCENLDGSKLDEQLKLHALDYISKGVQNIWLICVAFHSVEDYEAFDVPMDKAYDIDSRYATKFIF